MNFSKYINDRRFFFVSFAALAVILFLIFKPSKVNKENYVTPIKQEIREVVSGSGTLNASGVTQIYSPTAGIVKKVYVADGQEVKTGDKLFEVTSSATEQEKAAALSDLLAAKSTLRTAENAKESLQASLETARRTILETENSKKTFDENVVAQKPNPSTDRAYTEEEKLAMTSSLYIVRKSFSNLEKQYIDADEAIRSAQANLSEKSVSYAATRDSITKSPYSGKVFNLKKTTGDSVGTSLSKEPFLVLANLDSMIIEFQISEFNINKIKLGDKVEVKFDAILDQVVMGEVVGVDTVGNQQLGTVTYGVTIRLTPDKKQLELIRPAMTANITIVTNKKADALTIPRSAIKLDKAKYYAVILEKGKQKMVELKLGLIGTDTVEVLEGVTPETQVLKIYTELKK